MNSITFMIMGDVHLDSDFPGDMAVRRREQRNAFDEAIELVKKYGFDYLFIPGDLFDKRLPGIETVNYVKRAFADIKHTNVVIAPGNHDPFTIDSPYYDSASWPENVFIFKDKNVDFIEFDSHSQIITASQKDKIYNEDVKVEEKHRVRVYGAAFDGHFIRDSLISNEPGKMPRISSGFVNVLLIHGTFSKEKLTYNPLDEEVLLSCGFDLYAIGGTHKIKKSDKFLSSGVLYPRNFDELGETGVIVGEITLNGKVLSEFIPLNKFEYQKLELDVTNVDDLSEKSLAEKIGSLSKEGNCISVTLKGATQYGEEIDIGGVKETLLTKFKLVEIYDKTVKSENIVALSQENTPRGFFAKEIIAISKENSELTNTEVDKAIMVALKTFGSNGGNS